jgi:microcystin-dependent protein
MPAHSHAGLTGGAGGHSHYVPVDTGGSGPHGDGWMGTGGWNTANELGATREVGAHQHGIAAEGGDKPHENLPPYYALAFIIKL